MPTTQQMIQRAEDLERRAQALRLAAVEMTDQAASNKAAVFPGYLDQARAVRQQQRATTNGNGHHPDTTGDGGLDRAGLIRAALAEGPQTTLAVQAYLAAHGDELGRSWVLKQLTTTPEVRKLGYGPGTRWAWGAKRERPRTQTPAPAVDVPAASEAAPEATEPPDREALLRRALADGPQSVAQIGAYLDAQGEHLDRSWLRKQLKALSGVRVIKHGPRDTTYALRGQATPATHARLALGRAAAHGVAAIAAQRQRSAALLTHFTDEPKTNAQLEAEGVTPAQRRRLGGLLRHGYVKQKADGWVRTHKVYTT